MERGRRQRVDVITSLLARLSDDDLRALEQAAAALARALDQTI
jgi:hypothetical protein